MSAHLSAAEAARMYGLSEKTVRSSIRSGRLRADRRDGTYSVALDDVSALAAKVPGHGSGQLSAPVFAQESAPGADTSDEDVRPSEMPATDIMRAEAMASYTRSVLEPLVAALEPRQARVAELDREAGTYAERMAGLERVRDGPRRRPGGEARIRDYTPAGAGTRPVPQAGRPRRQLPKWRRWLVALAGGGRLVIVVVGSSCQQAAAGKHAELCSGASKSADSYAREMTTTTVPTVFRPDAEALLNVMQRTW